MSAMSVGCPRSARGPTSTSRTWPYEYKAVFSPADVIEEYTRPARLVEHGQVVVRPALSEVELCDFAGVGTLEAFNTDGLRSLIRTLDIPNMAEKTLRYPGHADLMRTFRESGFFDTQPVQIGEAWVRPLDLTSRLLFEQWRREPEEADLTVMQVVIEGLARGMRGEVRQRYTYDLLDRYDPETQTTSMARTTGYTCAIVARQVINGLFRSAAFTCRKRSPLWRRKCQLSQEVYYEHPGCPLTSGAYSRRRAGSRAGGVCALAGHRAVRGGVSGSIRARVSRQAPAGAVCRGRAFGDRRWPAL